MDRRGQFVHWAKFSSEGQNPELEDIVTEARWLSPAEFALSKGINVKTVYRRIKAGEIPARKVGRQWRILDSEYDNSKELNNQAHHSSLIDTLGSASMEVQRYADSFPTVYGWSYRIPSNALVFSAVSGRPHVELHLAAEGEYGWQYANEHLETGLPRTLAALVTVKRAFGRYWQILCKLEDQYRAEVDELVAKELHSVQIDNGHFFRSILSEVDKPQSTPSLDDYEIRTHLDMVSVVKVVSAANENLARQWMKRHLEWRKSFVMNDRDGLLRLRSEVQMSAKQFCDSISEREVAGRLPGSCSLCEPSTPKSTA